MKNYYEILGVSKSATQEEIKKTYKTLSKQYHPDVNPNGEDKFKEISQAYDMIGDPIKRKKYDLESQSPFGFDSSFDFNSMFDEIIGGNSHFKKKSADKVIKIHVSPEESFNGTEKQINININAICNNCEGSGGSKKICNRCNGNGYMTQTVGSGFFKTTIQSNCFECKGAGEFLIDSCNFCNGNGVVLKNSTFNVIIPKNVDNGDFMRMVGIGDEHPKHDKGDIIIQVICSKTNNFEKSKYDLIYYLKLTLTELILLDDIEIPHPNGTIKINIPKNLDTDKPLRIFKKGYKINDHVGDFYIKLSIINNLSLTKEEKDKIITLIK